MPKRGGFNLVGALSKGLNVARNADNVLRALGIGKKRKAKKGGRRRVGVKKIARPVRARLMY